MKVWFALLFGLGVGFAAAAATPLPKDSIYQLPVTITDQDGHAATFASRRGEVQIVSMFYTSCDMVCPMIIDTMQLTARAVAKDGGATPRLLAVSFDAAHDDVAALRAYAARRKLDLRQWTLARAEAGDARSLSALLGISWRAQAGGHFNHTSRLVLLDRDGLVQAATETIGRVDPAFITAVREALATSDAARDGNEVR